MTKNIGKQKCFSLSRKEKMGFTMKNFNFFFFFGMGGGRKGVNGKPI